jgi:ParB family chromosome partitioning protein
MSDLIPCATRPLTAIEVGPRHRKQFGNLHLLAESMATVGLLHPLVITPDNRLVAGARRLAAAQALGWQEIPVRVIDLPSMLQAEHDENVIREPFLPTEAVAIGRALEEEIAATNAAKMREAGKEGGRGKKKENPSINNTKVSAGQNHAARTTSQVGKAVGLSGTTYTKAKAVVLAAEAEPERYGDLVTAMDTTGKVDHAYQAMQRREATDALPGKSPHQVSDEDPARRWHKSFHDLFMFMNSVKHFAGGDLSNLVSKSVLPLTARKRSSVSFSLASCQPCAGAHDGKDPQA